MVRCSARDRLQDAPAIGRVVERRPGPMHGLACEPGQALTGAALSDVSPVPPVSWPSFHDAVVNCERNTVRVILVWGQGVWDQGVGEKRG